MTPSKDTNVVTISFRMLIPPLGLPSGDGGDARTDYGERNHPRSAAREPKPRQQAGRGGTHDHRKYRV
jgi:hypothetical protein